MGEINEALKAFSQKLKRFNEAGESDRKVDDKKSASGHQDPKFLQQQLMEREERLKATVISTYRIYKAPFEAMGKMSDRAKAIDFDQRSLLKAYNLFDGAFKLNQGEAAGGDGELSDTHTTFINKIEITSPLVQKAVYTTGGQFIYLICWLYFEQDCRAYFPVLSEKNKGWSLGFVPAGEYVFENHDKEIFETIAREFYQESGEPGDLTEN